ncbi:MAG: L-lactate dehydrogenase [Hyphomicrobiales bacterium]
MKVGIVGAGLVGSAAGYALALTGAINKVTFVDLNADLARAQADDISHAVPFVSNTIVESGAYKDLTDAAVVILAAGVNQKPEETRLELLERNAEVFRSIIDEVLTNAPHAILLVASNPVDIMTDITIRLSKLPPNRVIGSGTILDTARFRNLVGKHLGISPHSIHGYVLGEHGDSEVLSWSTARAGSVDINEFAAQIGAPITDHVKQHIDDSVRKAAYHIINGKGATWYGIGAGLARIIKAIAQDQQAVLSVSTMTPNVQGIEDVALSLPRIIGANGVVGDLMPSLNEAERKALAASARLLKETATNIEI